MIVITTEEKILTPENIIKQDPRAWSIGLK